MRRMIAIVFAAWVAPSGSWADETVEREMRQDVMLRALVDELERNQEGLTLEDLQRPYFLEFGLQDSAQVSVSADLGAVSRRNENRSRNLRCEVRVGSYALDNTNFSGGGYGGYWGWGGGASLPIEDDYNAIRQALWWSTDRQYKQVVETFEKKTAFMKSKMIEDKPDDFSKESPTVYFEERVRVVLDPAPLEKLAVALSAIFKDYPDIQNSQVDVQGVTGNKYLVNTEGTRMRFPGSRFAVAVSATVQCDDGMKLSDAVSLHAKKFEDLPPLEDVSRRCREMIDRLIAVKNAPKLESYTGPVLFEPEAAANIFSQTFASRFAGGQRPVGSQSDPEDFEQRLQRRILPRFLNVVDDPTQEKVAGQPAMGHYKHDDQGLKAQSVKLVEHGRLESLLMARNPSKILKTSNGHGRGFFRPSSSIGSLIVSTSDPLDDKTLRQEMLEACADEGLEFGLRIAKLGSIGGGGGGGYEYGGGRWSGDGGGGSTPLVMYKIHPDGREELVRGAETANIDLKAFKRMLGAGSTPYVLNSAGWGGSTTVAAPALLFEELDLAKVDRDFDKPPILPTPLARGMAGTGK